MVHDVEIRHAGLIAPSICTSCSPTRPLIMLARSRRCPSGYTAAGALRLEMGTLCAGGRLRARIEWPRAAQGEVDGLFVQHDALVLPTLPVPAPPLGAEEVLIGHEARAGPQSHAAA